MAQAVCHRPLTQNARFQFQCSVGGTFSDKDAVELVSPCLLWFYPVDTIPPPFRILSAIHHQHHIKLILATVSLSNTKNDICKRHAGANLSGRY